MQNTDFINVRTHETLNQKLSNYNENIIRQFRLKGVTVLRNKDYCHRYSTTKNKKKIITHYQIHGIANAMDKFVHRPMECPKCWFIVAYRMLHSVEYYTVVNSWTF